MLSNRGFENINLERRFSPFYGSVDYVGVGGRTEPLQDDENMQFLPNTLDFSDEN